ncbi:MAG TPA: RelA/SpoT domain-containing protein [Solirubrobacterales bacterium]|nr:RelA/SpoT domain-containing protein [Solirubrobacterales bacterium]
MAASKSKIDRAGRMLRDWWQAPSGSAETQAFDEGELTAAVGVMVDYRSGFQDPLKKVTVGLRQFVERESSEIVVGQRLKRDPQILNKLGRFSSMRLTQMEDIAGCRAILPGGATEVAGVLKRIRRNWDVVRIDDYLASPKNTGYRALHVVVHRDGHPVEIQLRTPSQHEWAEAVERWAARTRFPLKDGEGPPELLTYLELVAWAISADERGKKPDDDFMHVLSRFKARIDHYLNPSE